MVRLLLARALRRGLWEGSRPWMVVGVLTWVLRLMRKDEEQEVVFSERLETDQSITVTVRGSR